MQGYYSLERKMNNKPNIISITVYLTCTTFTGRKNWEEISLNNFGQLLLLQNSPLIMPLCNFLSFCVLL